MSLPACDLAHSRTEFYLLGQPTQIRCSFLNGSETRSVASVLIAYKIVMDQSSIKSVDYFLKLRCGRCLRREKDFKARLISHQVLALLKGNSAVVPSLSYKDGNLSAGVRLFMSIQQNVNVNACFQRPENPFVHDKSLSLH